MKSSMIVILMLSAVFAFAVAPADQLNKQETKWVEQLDHPKAEKRMQAMENLVELECKQAKDKLVELMQDDSAYQNRITAAKSLLELGITDVAELVEKQAEREEKAVAQNTLKAIAKQMKENS